MQFLFLKSNELDLYKIVVLRVCAFVYAYLRVYNVFIQSAVDFNLPNVLQAV